MEAEEDALFLIAQKADGALRDALSLFDKVVSYSDGKITRKIVSESMSILDYDAYFKMVDLFLKNDIPEVLKYFNELLYKGFDAHQFIAGLSAHLRDLLVAKEPKTIDLLEVSDNIKKQYLKQSKAVDMPFLMQALSLTTQTDIDYKKSKSPHLLVELTLMKLASLSFDEAKKKIVDIIPASHFKNTVKVVEAYKPEPKVQVKITEPPITTKKTDNKTNQVDKPPKKATGLSIKSLKKKKEEILKQKEALAGQERPKEQFTQEDFEKYWGEYLDKLRKNHERNMLSILTIDKNPRVEVPYIHLTLTSEALKTELERAKEKILNFLRYNLRNYDIDFKIKVNEEKKKDFVYTKEQKFNKMMEKYPDLAYLKSKFKIEF